MIVLKTSLIITLILILIQDYREHKVYWFLFPVVGLLCGLLFYAQILPLQFMIAIVMNFVFVLVLISSVFLYSKLKLKRSMGSVIGSGDVLFFLALIFTFSTISFIVLLTCSLIFALLMHLLLKEGTKTKVVPLAGFISCFFAMAYLAFWFGFIDSVYII